MHVNDNHNTVDESDVCPECGKPLQLGTGGTRRLCPDRESQGEPTQSLEERLFYQALEADEAIRWEQLRIACGTDVDMYGRIASLLEAHASPAKLFQDINASSPTESCLGVSDEDRPWIGPYKLLQKIGEGGMGSVYMADQAIPVRRRVALKVIKDGYGSKESIARFEAERQALAIMEHPNIAKMLDAGTTDSGRPFFVMELVKGVPITEFCDAHALSPIERLELMIPVCQAVQHAHQKGIIHRDIKPSNVLVAECDDHPIPKVIDFGVAKALNQTLTDKSMFTHYGQIVGTLEYMSPEQARLNQLDVDTRSDVYSLGVMLYELLTGTTPFDRMRMRTAAFDELLRILREEEPPRPSVRIGSSDTLPMIAAKRKIDRGRLGPYRLHQRNGSPNRLSLVLIKDDRSVRVRSNVPWTTSPSSFHSTHSSENLIDLAASETIMTNDERMRAVRNRLHHSQIRLIAQPENDAALFGRGWARFYRRLYDLAVVDFNELINRAGPKMEYLAFRARCWARLKQAEAANRDLEMLRDR